MKLLCKEVKSYSEAEKFIALCEKKFENKLREASREVLRQGNRVITLSGPSCSGKTTTAAMLVDEIEKSGHNAVVISIDDFYLDNLRVGMAEGKKIDFDSVKTIDLEYLADFTEKLLKLESVKIPSFDFTTGCRSGYRDFQPTEKDIFIFEGIQAVYPEVTALFGDAYTSVFICVKDEVLCNGVYFSPHEIRLLRRIVRDFYFRNTRPEQTLMIWESVRENEEIAIFPNADNPDFFIDSFLTYELYMISHFALPLLREVPLGSVYKSVADSLISRLEELDNRYYLNEFVPDDSMFREFIGKRNINKI